MILPVLAEYLVSKGGHSSWTCWSHDSMASVSLEAWTAVVLGVRAPPGGDVRRQFEVSLTPHVSPSGAPSRRPWVGAARGRWGDKVQVGGLANGLDTG